MIASMLSVLLALAIGATCRKAEIPLPAPPKLVGALLVLAMTFGFTVTDWLLQSG
jgi:XapX domain-containing protein